MMMLLLFIGAWGEHLEAWGEHLEAWGEHLEAWGEHLEAWTPGHLDTMDTWTPGYPKKFGGRGQGARRFFFKKSDGHLDTWIPEKIRWEGVGSQKIFFKKIGLYGESLSEVLSRERMLTEGCQKAARVPPRMRPRTVG